MRRALLVGIDDEPSKAPDAERNDDGSVKVNLEDFPSDSLKGCTQDAERMENALARHEDGSVNFECRRLTAPLEAVTRASLRKAIKELFAYPASVALLHFSGHGTVNNLGGYLVTQDASTYDEGVPMTDVLTFANESPVQDVVITLDCCHSGALGSVPALGNDHAVLREGVSVLTASRANQPSLEEGGGGVFTSLLVDALKGAAAGLLGEVTAAGMYAYVDNALGAWDQRPLFKAHVSRFTSLRTCRPRVALEDLREVLTLFPLPAEEFPLTPAHEPTAEPHDEAKEAEFKVLQELRLAGLVEPVGEDHMHYAAMRSKACRLTRLGRYYWRLLDAGKI